MNLNWQELSPLQKKYKIKKAWKKAKLVYFFIRLRKNQIKKEKDDPDD